MFTFVLPQSVVRTMGYKDVKSLHRAMIVGTVIIGAMMIGATALGVLAAGVLTEDLAATAAVDNIIPLAISRTLPPVLAGIAIIGPVAASISTVSSLLISSSSALVKDVWMHYAGRAAAAWGACAVRVEPGGYAGAGRGGVRAGRRAARTPYGRSPRRLRRPRDGVFWVMVCGLF
ncbi:MAG: sodium:solute symporter family transporter [Eggerthellaceae bacterium]